MFHLREPQMESDDNAAIDRGQREGERGARRREEREREREVSMMYRVV